MQKILSKFKQKIYLIKLHHLTYSPLQPLSTPITQFASPSSQCRLVATSPIDQTRSYTALCPFLQVTKNPNEFVGSFHSAITTLQCYCDIRDGSMEVLLVGPRPERRRLVDAAQEVAEAGGFRSLDAAVAVLLQLGPRRAVQELVDVDAGGAAADGRVERDHAATAAAGVLMMRGRRFHWALGRRRARYVEVDLGAVLAAVAAGRLRLLC